MPIARKIIAILVVLILGLIHYRLANLPVSVNISSDICKECSPIKTEPGQVLSFGGIAQENINHGFPLIRWGPISAANIHFDEAVLEPRLLAQLQHFQPNIPNTPQPVDFNIFNSIDNKIYISIFLSKRLESSNNLSLSLQPPTELIPLELKLKAEGLEPIFQIHQGNIGINPVQIPVNLLKIGGWQYKMAGIPISLIPKPGTASVIRLFSGLVPPQLKTTMKLPVKEIGVATQQDSHEISDKLLCSAPKNGQYLFNVTNDFSVNGCTQISKTEGLLMLTELNIEKSEISLSLTGNAWAQLKGEIITKNMNALIKENPYWVALLALFDAFILKWLKKQLGIKDEESKARKKLTSNI